MDNKENMNPMQELSDEELSQVTGGGEDTLEMKIVGFNHDFRTQTFGDSFGVNLMFSEKPYFEIDPNT